MGRYDGDDEYDEPQPETRQVHLIEMLFYGCIACGGVVLIILAIVTGLTDTAG